MSDLSRPPDSTGDVTRDSTGVSRRLAALERRVERRTGEDFMAQLGAAAGRAVRAKLEPLQAEVRALTELVATLEAERAERVEAAAARTARRARPKVAAE